MRENFEEEETFSSPSREFSFTISLHQKSPTPSLAAVDLSPADDIFFHGHLLPLHLLSHLPVSPRYSTTSIDSFTLPITELKTNAPEAQLDTVSDTGLLQAQGQARRPCSTSKPFSFFRWKNSRGNGHVDIGDKQKRKIIHILKRYISMVRPILSSFRERRREKAAVRRQPHTFSGRLTSSSDYKGSPGEIVKRGQLSAPASMRTSPNNSGILNQKAILRAATSDSTMEELQSAIQAAIAHCKNSIATKEDSKDKCIGG